MSDEEQVQIENQPEAPTEESASTMMDAPSKPVTEESITSLEVHEEVANTVSEAPVAPEVIPVSTATAVSNGNPKWRELLVRAREAITFRKRKKLDKILVFLEKKGSVTNDDVEKLLHVSDATATRYLSILESEGKIRQNGKKEHATYSRV